MRWLIALLFCSCAYGASTSDPTAYIYEGSQGLINLSGMSGTTNMNAGDDAVSGWSPDFGFDFDIWGNTYRKAKMSTNGCVNFSGLNCQDYTPQPLPYRDQTLYPFWTDLIRDSSSSMLFKSFNDYVVFGWYDLREFNRESSNSFEAILWKNDTYEYRYGALDIINHDVLIGEQHTSSVHKTFRYFDDGTGGHNNWDSFDASFSGGVLESGGSLYSGSFTDLCSANQLYSTSCSGYAAAYLAQQCGISSLYDSSCSGYAAAYLTQQCGISSLYSISCSGYAAAYLSQQCSADSTYDLTCDGYWDAVMTESVTDTYTDTVYGDEIEDFYFEEEDDFSDITTTFYEPEVMIYQETDDTYNDGSTGIIAGATETDDNYGWEEPEETYMAMTEATEDFSNVSFEEEFFEEILIEEELFESLFTEEVFAEIEIFEDDFYEEEIFEETIALIEEEIFFDDELSAELEEEYIEEQIAEEGRITEEELEIQEEILEEERVEEERIEEERQEIEVQLAEEAIAEREEEAIELEIEAAEIAELEIADQETKVINIALSIVQETSVIATALAEGPVLSGGSVFQSSSFEAAKPQQVFSQFKPQQVFSQSNSQQLFSNNDSSGPQIAVSTQNFEQGTFTITATPEAVLADSGYSESVDDTSTTAVTETVFDFGNSGNMQLAQLGQTDIQQSFDTGGSTDVFGDTGFFEPEIEIVQDVISTGGVQTFDQASSSAEEAPAEELEIMQDLSASVTEMNFEQDFNDAIATGQSIGQFLSNQLPDFGQFDVAPPSGDEARTVQRAETALETMTDAEIEQSIESQLESIQDSGGFGDQTLTILLMSRVQGFDAYGIEIQDQQQWYQDREIYGGNAPVDGDVRAFQGGGAQKFQEMLQGQYER